MQELLPVTAVGVETYEDPPGADLCAEEEPFVARAVEARRREFATVRWCARAALAQLGLPRAPILPGERGAPTWPGAIVGSMTHCAGYPPRARRAYVAQRDRAPPGADASVRVPCSP